MDKIKTQQELLEESNILKSEIDQLKTEVEKLKKFKTETQNTKNDSKLKKAEEVAKLNTDRFRDLVDSTDGIVWEADAQTFKFTFVSKKAERLLGYPIKDWYKDGFWASNIYEEDKIKTINFCSSQTKKKLPHDFEYRFVSKNGKIFWLRDIVSVVVKNGIPYKLRGIMVDITKLKQAELSLIENEERLNEALEITRLGTFSFDDSTDLFETSSICDEIIGIDHYYIKNIQGWINFVHPEDYENAQLLLDKANLEYVSSEFRIIRPKDKKIIWILGHAKKEYDHNGVRTKITGTIKDISKRKQADNDLRMSELRLREAQSVAHIGSFEGDIYNDELWWSDELFDLFGLKTNEFKITKDGFNQLIHPDEKDEYISNLMSCLETGDSFRREFRGKHTSGEWRYFETVAGITYDTAGEILGMRGTVQDITERKLVEKAIRKTQIFNESLLKTSPDIIYVYNIIEGKKVYSNERIMKILGYSVKEVQTFGENLISKIMHPDDFKIFLNEIVPQYQTIKDGEIIEHEYRMKHKKGNWCWLHSKESIFKRNDNGVPLQIFGISSDITKQKSIGEKLLESNEKYLNLMDNLGTGVVLHAPDTSILLSNPKASEILGVSPEQMKGKKVIDPKWKFVRNDGTDLPIEDYPVNKALSLKKSFSDYLIGIKRPDRKYITWVDVNASIVFDNDNNIEYVTISFNDKTERKQVEQALKESEEQFKGLMKQSPFSIQILDTSGNTKLVNSAFEDMWGVKIEDLKDYNLLQDEQLIKLEIMPFLEKVFAGEAAIMPITEYDVKDTIGKGLKKWVQAHAYPIKDSTGKVINVTLVHEDITARKQAEEKLQESQAFNESLLQSSPDIIYIYNIIERKNVYSNNGINLVLGYSVKEIQDFGENLISNLMHPDDFVDYCNNIIPKYQTAKEGELIVHEFRMKYKNGDWRWLSAKESIFKRLDNGKPFQIFGVATDITERKEIESELIKSKEKAEESNRLKTEFLQNMSHEIRTPMNGILGFTQMLDDAYLTDEKRAHFVNIIQNSGRELLHIIDDILEISKLETKQVSLIESEVCINDTFFELFSIFDIKAKEQGISLYFKKGLLDKESTIYTDKIKLNKILSNLLENALKFTTRGYVAFGYNLIKNNTLIEIYVKDTGIGIEPEKQKIIFERFSQAEKKISRKAGGLGLGLSIAKENAELLGGEISVESEMMSGAKFIVTIPYKPVKIKSIAKDENVSIQKVRHSCTILIAEDEEVNFLFLEILLMDKLKLSCDIIHAIDGEEAVEICKNNPNIDLVLMDIKMPKMNGYVATEEIKKIRPNLPIVAQTAYSTREDMEKAKAAGCNDFISKPIDKEILNDVIKKYMKKQQLE